MLVEPPSARLLLVTFAGGKLAITASQALSPPMPSLLRAEFFNGVRASGSAALVSLWTGLLACVEIEFEKPKDAKKRRASEAVITECEAGSRLVFKSSFNIKWVCGKAGSADAVVSGSTTSWILPLHRVTPRPRPCWRSSGCRRPTGSSCSPSSYPSPRTHLQTLEHPSTWSTHSTILFPLMMMRTSTSMACRSPHQQRVTSLLCRVTGRTTLGSSL